MALPNNQNNSTTQGSPTLPIITLILGIVSLLSLISCCFCLPVTTVFSIPGIICGILSLSMIKKGTIPTQSKGFALGGLICSIASLVIAFTLFMLSMVFNLISLPNSDQLIHKI